MSSVLCFGNVQLDVLCRTVTELPPPGGLRMIDAVDFALSGNGGNVAAALARLGVDVELAGCTGADVVGEQFRAQLAAEGVGLDLLRRHPTAGTGTSIIAVAPGGERSIIFVNGANDAYDLERVPDAALRDRAVVAVLSVMILPQYTGLAVADLFRRARAAGARTLLNICWDDQQRGLPFLEPALRETDYFVLNHDEGRQLTLLDDPAAILDRLAAYVRGTTVLTLGPEGCCYAARDGIEYIPAMPVAAVDTTGAGDTFVAGLIAGLVEERPLDQCARLGNGIAAYAVTGPGAFTRIPHRARAALQ